MKWDGKLMSDTEKNKIKYKMIYTLYIKVPSQTADFREILPHMI